MAELSAMAVSVGELLKQHQHTIVVTESSCGGLISASLVAVPGASAYYLGGAVVYIRAAQQSLLQVPDSAMADIRASSRTLRSAQRPQRPRIPWDDLGVERDRRQRPHGEPVWRSRRPRLFRRRRTGRAGRHTRNGQRGSRGQYVGLRQSRPGPAGAVPAEIWLAARPRNRVGEPLGV